jgi:hypothetical protein
MWFSIFYIIYFGKDNIKMKQIKKKVYIKTIDKINKLGEGRRAKGEGQRAQRTFAKIAKKNQSIDHRPLTIDLFNSV